MGNYVVQAVIDVHLPQVPATPQQEKLLYCAKNGDADALRDIANRLNRHTRQSVLSDSYPDNITPLVSKYASIQSLAFSSNLFVISHDNFLLLHFSLSLSVFDFL